MKLVSKTRAAGMMALITGAVLTGTAPPVQAFGDSPLPLPGYGDMVVDSVHKRVFVSGGASSNAVVVTDFSGSVKKTIASQFGASGMVLSADAATLYVALATGDAVSAIDTGTLTEAARFQTGAGTCPTHLARTVSSVWFGYSCDESFNGKIGLLDTAAAPPAVSLGKQGALRFQRAPYLASATDADGPVIAGQLDVSLSSLTLYAVDGADLRASTSTERAGSNLTDLDVSPDGTEFYSAAGSRDQIDAFATADLAGRGSYFTGAFPDAVAASPDGAHIAAGRRTSQSDDIQVYPLGGAQAVRDFDLGTGNTLASRGLAWNTDCDKLFAITQKANDPRPTLKVISNPTGLH